MNLPRNVVYLNADEANSHQLSAMLVDQFPN